jgi:chromosome segregation ATPase
MSDVTLSTGDGLEDGERRAERDLGAIANEVEHLAASITEHATTIEGLREDRAWITSRFEAIERDLQALPKVPDELASTVSESLANLANRIERLETPIQEERTRAPHRERESDEDRSLESDERKEKNRSTLDRLF